MAAEIGGKDKYIANLPTNTQDRTRVQFIVGDACDLPQLGQFGCVFAGNLICRLPEPLKFFERLPDLIVHGGILVITSPYTWLEQYTAKVPTNPSIMVELYIIHTQCIPFYSLIPRLKEKCFSYGLHGIKAKGSIAANVYL